MKWILLIAAIVVVGVLVCLGIFWYRKRSARDEEARKIVYRSSKGKKGYSIKDEKEDDDSDGEDDLNIDYAKPMLS